MNRIIIDVREPYEYDAGHVEGAINIPLSKLPHNISELDKSAEIIVYCASGARSSVAEKLLIGYGFEHVINGQTKSQTEKLV